MLIRSDQNGIAYLHSPLLDQCDFLTHAFCMRHGGVSEGEYRSLNLSFCTGDDEFRVLQNWGILATAFQIPAENFLVLNQIHSNDILLVDEKDNFSNSLEALDYDAIATSRANLAICIKTADCVPVFLVDPGKKAIAAVHAGWRGSALGIAAKAVKTMRDSYGSQPGQLLAAIGPSIGPCCYEVDFAVASQFFAHPQREVFLKPAKRKDHWMLNLTEVNFLELQRAGLSRAAIERAEECTVCRQDNYFSHRASGGAAGRQVNFMMIRKETPARILRFNHHSRIFH